MANGKGRLIHAGNSQIKFKLKKKNFLFNDDFFFLLFSNKLKFF